MAQEIVAGNGGKPQHVENTVEHVQNPAQPVGRAYRWTRRVFWAFAAVSLSGALGVMGVNGATVGAAALLGWPGWAAMAVLRLL